MEKKYIFILKFVIDDGYDDGVSEIDLVSSFDNNKLVVIREGLKKEMETFGNTMARAKENILALHKFNGVGKIPEHIRTALFEEEERIHKNFPLISKYFKKKVSLYDTVMDERTSFSITRLKIL